MKVAQVIGDVISTQKVEQLEGFKLLIVQPVSLITLKPEGEIFVAVDTVGAGEEEIVLCVQGSSARQTERTDAKPVDAAIVGIIDYIDIEGKRTFAKM